MKAATKGQIYHPTPGSPPRHAHFVAFGIADGSVKPAGKATDQNGKVIYGWKVKDDKSLQDGSQKFWGLYFQLELGNKYTLTIYDDVDDQPLGPCVDNIVPHEFFPNIAISYPIAPGDNPVPSEFIAYGTSDSGGQVTGTISDCGAGSTISQSTPPTPPTDWNLYCNIVMGGNNCDLKVTQGGTDVHSTGLSFT